MSFSAFAGVRRLSRHLTPYPGLEEKITGSTQADRYRRTMKEV